jgi:hypothetical protein
MNFKRILFETLLILSVAQVLNAQLYYDFRRLDTSSPIALISQSDSIYFQYSKRLNGTIYRTETLLKNYTTLDNNTKLEFVIRNSKIDMVVLSTFDQSPDSSYLLLMNFILTEFFSQPDTVIGWFQTKTDSLVSINRGYAVSEFENIQIQLSKLDEGFTCGFTKINYSQGITY